MRELDALDEKFGRYREEKSETRRNLPSVPLAADEIGGDRSPTWDRKIDITKECSSKMSQQGGMRKKLTRN